MHYGVVPITDDGRLSAKEVVGNKKAFKNLTKRVRTSFRKKYLCGKS
ncbi:plasmid recombination protein [Staphylococcus argenteus]